MKYMAKYSQVYEDSAAQLIQKQCQQKLRFEELCSICNKDNYSHLENTLYQPPIISKGFFQTEAQRALQNSQIEKAFEIISVCEGVFSRSA